MTAGGIEELKENRKFKGVYLRKSNVKAIPQSAVLMTAPFTQGSLGLPDNLIKQRRGINPRLCFSLYGAATFLPDIV